MNAELILTNGVIRTMEGRVVEALAVNGGRILKVGGREEVLATACLDTEIIDLEGKTVLPGFIDTHGHLVGFGASLRSVDLMGARSADEIIDRCRRFIAEHHIPAGQWVFGRGWNQNLFTGDKSFPTRDVLDRISTDHPLLLLRTCGHIGLANTLALELAGVTADTFIEGGEFTLGADGKPNGIIKEASLEWFKQSGASGQNLDELRRNILAGAAGLLCHGVTTMHSEDTYDLGYSGAFRDIRETYLAMAEAGELPLRIYQKISLPKRRQVDEFLQSDLRTGQGNDFYCLGPMKQWCDGTLGARTAALLEDYSDDAGNRGIYVYDRDELYDNVRLAHNAGMQVCLHAIGDGALQQVLDVYEQVMTDFPRKDTRHRIVHCLVANRSQYERIARLGLIVNIQPLFTSSDIPFMNPRLGYERERECHAWRLLTDLGACLTGGSDIPVESPSVFAGIHAIVNRVSLSGDPPGTWLPEQAVTVDEALRMYTTNAAYSAFQEDEKGTLAEGKLADFIIVDRDPYAVPTDTLKDIQVLRTFVGGVTRYTL